MPRYKLTLEYDGSVYIGWQRQAQGISIQGVLEAALGRLAPHPTPLQGAGRTDSGVHAKGQVAHVDLERRWINWRLREAINAHLAPHKIVILDVEEVPHTFEARFSAVARRYIYRILNRRPRPALEASRVWHIPYPLDIYKMREAAQNLLGKHDFTTFRAADCQATSPVRTLSIFDIKQEGDEIHMITQARSFLHRQVRSMVGSLVEVGSGKWEIGEVKAALKACDRQRCGQVAPPTGLYLTHVFYEEGVSDVTITRTSTCGG